MLPISAPGGQIYYYNASTQESTYVRPMPAFPTMLAQPDTTKKEKPLVKTRIPGTDWLRVKTTGGNTFYSHKIKKESVWTVPDEIRDIVEKLEREESEERKQSKRDADADAEEVAREKEREMILEVERIKGEVQAMVKRKAEETAIIDEAVIIKKAKAEVDEREDDSESDEEEWQQEAAAQLAAEAEAEKKRSEEVERARKATEEEQQRLQINMPERVDLSLEEAKALFKVM